MKLFSTVESFYCLGQINHTSTDCLQLRWPLCVSERVCTFFLQLFTQLEDKHCTLPAKVCLMYLYTVSDWISALNSLLSLLPIPAFPPKYSTRMPLHPLPAICSRPNRHLSNSQHQRPDPLPRREKIRANGEQQQANHRAAECTP